MLEAYRIEAQTWPVTDKALEEKIFRAAHGVTRSLRDTLAHNVSRRRRTIPKLSQGGG